MMPSQLDHCQRGVGRNHPVTTLDEVPRQVTAAAAEFDHQTVAFADRGEQGEHARCACLRMHSKRRVVGPSYTGGRRVTGNASRHIMASQRSR